LFARHIDTLENINEIYLNFEVDRYGSMAQPRGGGKWAIAHCNF